MKVILKNSFGVFDGHIRLQRYADNNRLAILLMEEEGSSQIVFKATVNIPDLDLADDEVFIKGWSENEGVPNALMDAGVIGPIIGYGQTGRAMATRHKVLITEDDLEAQAS